jgi:hypothetical protein
MENIDRRTVFAAGLAAASLISNTSASAQQADGGSAETRLRELGIELPKVPAPAEVIGACSERRNCRVGPGNFTLSPSQNRTRHSHVIRLVPPREGCRLPFKIGFLPLPVDRSQWRWPAPFAPRALPSFITTTNSRRKSWREGPHPRGAAIRRPRPGH